MNKKKWLILSLSLIALLAVLLAVPLTVMAAPGEPDMTGYYMCKANIKAFGLDGLRHDTTYRYIGISIGDQTDNTMAADDCELDLYITNNVKGVAVRNGTGRHTKPRLEIGNNTVTVSTEGTFTVRLPAGVTGTATTGTSAVSGSPVTLATGDNTITTTGTGTFTLALALDKLTIGTLSGAVGEGTRARFQLIGSDPIVTVADGTGTATGAPLWLVPASSTVTVSGAGTFTITVPTGMSGTVTSGTATVVESPVTLVEGANTIDTGVTTGTFTVALRATSAYVLNGKVLYARSGEIKGVNGIISGFVVIDRDPWTILSFDSRFSGRYEALD